ncbi:MAG: DegT/DnrJ/EryC1/StrS family aminotransferase [Verrucomicrobiota bacterium]|nr:DegT/DnrJ/EryC1/StrS family aminotransferase [Verrucomicrobiota bacterium]MCC6822501.1 DegT/DnrJ/EryC1/StrS family aminotransferase [Limisphaerales bacterium]
MTASKLALFGGKPLRSRPFTAWPIFGQPEEKRLLRTLHSGKWGKLNGPEVAEFERRFAAMHGCKHGIGVVNGTVSLRIALLAAGIRAEDEVIVPTYTFFSTASAVIEANAVPVFVDIDLNTFNLDPKAVAAAITPRTRAIIPVHFAGQPADMRAIMTLARKHKLVVIEDAAHAHGASYRNQPAGSIGHMASFSFQSSKNLTSGEGGLLTMNDDALAAACRSIHNCGRIPTGIWYEHHVISGNYRLGEFQGAVLNAQLDRLETQTKTRNRNGQHLATRLAQLPGLHPQKRDADCTRHSYHLFMLRVDGHEFGTPRAAVIKALQAEGIPCSGGYGLSLHHQPLFRNKAFGPYLPKATAKLNYQKTKCPNSDLICREQCIWLEHGIFLGSRSDIDDVARAFEKIHENRAGLNAWAKKPSLK